MKQTETKKKRIHQRTTTIISHLPHNYNQHHARPPHHTPTPQTTSSQLAATLSPTIASEEDEGDDHAEVRCTGSSCGWGCGNEPSHALLVGHCRTIVSDCWLYYAVEDLRRCPQIDVDIV